MKIAFVWKWWSWKTTLTSLFIKNLLSENKKVIAVDADINVWLASGLWIYVDNDKYLSKDSNVFSIRKKLIHNNDKILSVSHFVKTTPPTKKSYIIEFWDSDFFDNFSSYSDEKIKFFHVWTYEKDEIWISCYHTHLSILENIVSHTNLNKNEFMVVDMVAWNDSFSNTLHSQFDVMFLIVEPTVESINMIKKFLELSNHSNESSKIIFIWNKIEDNDDLDFIKSSWINLNFYFPYNKNFKKYRREWIMILDNDLKYKFNDILKYLDENIIIDKNKKLFDLYNLHKKYIELDYIKTPLWDLSNQIDLDFNFK